MRLAEVREQLGAPVTMALTATATPPVRNDIVSMLQLRSPKMHVTGFDRPNLTYACRRIDFEYAKDEALAHGLSKQPGSGIVYCATRKKVEQLTLFLHEKFPQRTIRAYHAGMDSELRTKSQQDFMSNAGCGGGGDQRVRHGHQQARHPVCGALQHSRQPGGLLPGSRTGGTRWAAGAVRLVLQPGRSAYPGVLHQQDRREQRAHLSESQVELLQSHATQKLERMFQYAYARRCRRRSILAYFGDDSEVTRCSCDVCRGDVRMQPSPAAERTTEQTKAGGEPKPADSDAGPAGSRGGTTLPRLKSGALQLAQAHGWSAFWVAHDSVLRDIARAAPQTLACLGATFEGSVSRSWRSSGRRCCRR